MNTRRLGFYVVIMVVCLTALLHSADRLLTFAQGQPAQTADAISGDQVDRSGASIVALAGHGIPSTTLTPKIPAMSFAFVTVRDWLPVGRKGASQCQRIA